MKKIIVLLFFTNLYFVNGQHNIIKNGDFRETIGDYTSSIRRVDIEFGTPKNWKNIGPGMIAVYPANYDFTEKEFRNEWDKRALISAQAKANKEDILVNLLTARKTERVIAPRKYLFGYLKYPLLKGKKYQVKLRLYVTDLACKGLSHFGIKLEKKYPNSANKSAKEDSSALQFAINNQLNEWIELEGVIEAEGAERFIVIGCFSQEEDLHLYQEYEKDYYIRKISEKEVFRRLKRKKLCPENWGQVVLISNISIEALDSSEWALLEPQQDSLQTDSTSILSQKTPDKPVQDYQKNYQANFAKNSYAIEAEMLQEVLNDLQELEEKNASYHIYLTGHTDDEGSLEANEKLSQQRAEAIQNWLLENNTNAKQITIDYKGERALLGADAAKNRRVEIRLEYQAIERVLEE